MARAHAGDTEGAERDYRAAIADDAEFLGARVGLAALLVNAHRYDEALSTYDAIVAHWPGFAAAHVGRGILLHELGRRDEALAAFRRAVEVADDRPRYERRLAEYEALLAASSP
jgi:protein O-GlcNAc transferase